MKPRTDNGGTRKRGRASASAGQRKPARRRKAAKGRAGSVEKKLSRLRKPEEMSLDDWQVALRRQYGREQKFRLKNLGEDPIFSEFEVTNPETQRTYRVAIRGYALGENFCTCPDFAVNTLGTCKHIEFTLAKLARKRGAKPALAAGYQPTFSEIYLQYGARRVVVATPVAPPQTVDLLREDADEVVCMSTPSPFWAIGEFYDDFTQTNDEEVAQLLDAAANRRRIAARREKPAKRDPLLEHAAEEAEGIEYFADSGHDALFVAAREEAQGIEVFSNPDVALPSSALREGDPGHESFTGDDLGLGREVDEERER